MSRISRKVFHPLLPALQFNGPSGIKKSADKSQISKLLARIAILRQNMLTGETFMFDWMKRRIQPLQARESLGFQYQGTTDPSRYSKEEISDDVVFSRMQRLLKNVNTTPVVPDTFSVANPPKQVLDKSSRFIENQVLYHSVNLIGFAFCRRTWIVLRVVLRYQAFIRPFLLFQFPRSVNQILVYSHEVSYKQY